MDRIKPHLIPVAIALRIPRHFINSIRTEDDPVYKILDLWLQGKANPEEDSLSLITWATLISALKEANVQEEAKILENIVDADELQSSEFLCFTQQ